MTQLHLHDILTSEVDCINPEATLRSVFKILTEHNYSCCVIASENRIPLGIITENDLVRIISLNSSDPKIMDRHVITFMTASAFSLTENTLVDEAIQHIEEKKLKHLLVTGADGVIKGIVSQTDIVKAYSRLKEIHTKELQFKIEQRTEQLEAVNRKLVTLSMLDPLTGLGNRRSMEVDIMKVHSLGIRHRRPYSIVLFDIDFFKKYNDHYGHQAGDKILETVAKHFKTSIRESDSVYRYGGEEFLLVMPDTNVDKAIIPVTRIIESLCAQQVQHEDCPLGILTTSAGLACSHHHGQRLASWRQVVEMADEGLYEAKASGRNCLNICQRTTLKAVN